MNQQEKQEWDLIITSKPKGFSLGLKELWKYKDLVFLFVKRDFVSQFKQSILGPLWYIIQPLLTTVVFTILLGGVLGRSAGLPYPIFALSGITIWNLFNAMLGKTSNTFVANASIFGKVYFPRLTVPISVVLSNYISFLIQFLLFVIVMLYYVYFKEYSWHINYAAMPLLILCVLIISLMGMGFGLIISSLTTKYRDLTYLVGFGMQLWMYASVVIIPFKSLPEKVSVFIQYNPMVPIINAFRHVMLSYDEVPYTIFSLAYPSIVALITLGFGLFIFSRVEKSFTDTV